MALRHEDTVAGATLVAAGVIVTELALNMDQGTEGATLAPNFFPLICSIGLIICGAVLLVKGLLAKSAPLPALLDARIAIVGALIFVFYWWFGEIDFRVGCWVLTFVTMLSFGIRSVRQLIIVPLVLTIVLYFGFTDGFNVVLPTWI